MSSEVVPVTPAPEPSLMEYIQRKNAGEPPIEIKPESLAAEDVQTPKTEEPVAPAAPVVEPKTEDADPESELPKEGEEVESKSKGGFQRRIDKLTKQLRLTEQERDTLREKSAKPAAEESQPQAPKSDKPKIEDFQSPDEWADARDAWKEKQEQFAEFQERQKAVFENFNKQVSAAREEYDDFDEAIRGNIPIPVSVQDAIPTLDNGAAVMYHIAKNPDIAAKLMEMLPARAIAEVGRISERLLSAQSTASRPPTKEKIVSKAEAPIQPVGGTAKSTVALEDLPPSDYIAKRNAQVAKRQAG